MSPADLGFLWSRSWSRFWSVSWSRSSSSATERAHLVEVPGVSRRCYWIQSKSLFPSENHTHPSVLAARAGEGPEPSFQLSPGSLELSLELVLPPCLQVYSSCQEYRQGNHTCPHNPQVPPCPQRRLPWLSSLTHAGNAENAIPTLYLVTRTPDVASLSGHKLTCRFAQSLACSPLQ